MKKNYLNAIVILCIFLGITSLLVFFINFRHHSLSVESSDWGAFGAYVSGLVGTIFSFISVVLIYFTLNGQNKNFYQQQFEASFFNLLSAQKDTILKIKEAYIYEGYSGYGKDLYLNSHQYIYTFSNELKRKISECKNIDTLEKISHEEKINKKFNYLLEMGEYQLSHYFRNLYHIVKFVHESNIVDKKKYIDIIQAQMSDHELYITFYNGISKFGNERFKPLLDQYQILENIQSRDKAFEIHKKLFYPNTNFKHS
ncbi:MAG: putative phage abortive infection protein [Desulfuromonadaceae bacterium]|nr:putative phage abortive infection protein [Desulfuromonadaceae bacterium]